MTHPSQYWTLRTVQADLDAFNQKSNLVSGRILPHVQAYFQTQFPECAELPRLSPTEDRQIQAALFSQWFDPNPSLESHPVESQGLAGLCLRCYISHAIVQACQELAQRFHQRYGFTAKDILPIVLTDDGRKLLFWNRDRQIQLEVNRKGQWVVSAYTLFAIQILAKFNPEKGNLNTWTKQLTRYYLPMQDCLRIEYGCLLRTDWSILNGVTQSQRKSLSARDCQILAVFHRVYRRDRRGKRNRCPDPSASQLAEMLHLLSQQGIFFESGDDLRQQLLAIADIIRQKMIHPASGNQWGEAHQEVDIQQFMSCLEADLIQALKDAIAQEVPQMINRVQKSKTYSPYAASIISALKLLYFQGKSQREIASCLRMKNQSQVCRILKLKPFINAVRYRVVEQLFPIVVNKLKLDSEFIAQNIERFNTIMQSLEQYVDETVFQEAIAEIRAGQNRRMGSLFAQQMCQYLKQYSQGE